MRSSASRLFQAVVQRKLAKEMIAHLDKHNTLDTVIMRSSPTGGNFFYCYKIFGFALADISGSFVLNAKNSNV